MVGHVFFAEGFVAVFTFCVERRQRSAFGALDHLHVQLLSLVWFSRGLSVFLDLLWHRAVVPFQYQLPERSRSWIF